ncbi:MAG: hypothetical protein GXO86_02145 [Chlorobi bacterium]|nr:hypothetical protein [Chlorobiota bacterium]
MEKLLTKLLEHKWWIMIIILAITTYFVLEMRKNTRMETDLDKYMPQITLLLFTATKPKAGSTSRMVSSLPSKIK